MPRIAKANANQCDKPPNHEQTDEHQDSPIGVVTAAAMVSFGIQAQEITMATFGGGTEKTWEGAFAKPFTDETGISVKIVPVPSPEAQLRNPAARAQYNAALVTFPQGANLLKDGLIETFTAAKLPASADTNPKYVMRAKDGKLAGAFPYFIFYAIAFNNQQAKKSDFQSWSDLADPKWKGKIVLTRPIYLPSYDLPILAIAQGGSEKNIGPGVDLLKKIAPNALTQYSSMAHMNGLLTRGEVAAGPYYSSRVWALRRERGLNVDIVIPKEGALMIPYIVIVPKGAKNLEAVKKWLNYMSMAKPQLRAVALAGYFPLNQNAEISPALQEENGFTLKELMSKLHQPDWAVIAAPNKERTNQFLPASNRRVTRPEQLHDRETICMRSTGSSSARFIGSRFESIIEAKPDESATHRQGTCQAVRKTT